jgi:hypothetical protein
MARAMEQSLNPETAAFKHLSSDELPSQLREGGSRSEQGSKPTAVRVVGMDESTGSRSDGALSDTVRGPGPSQAQPPTQPAGGTPGQLVLGEGKSQYIPSPFWEA